MFKSLILSGLCVFTALAQAPTKIVAERSSPIGITAVMAGPAVAIPGAPYSAQAVTQRVQTLLDGNRITQTTTNAVARDSKGRVYREESLPGQPDSTPHIAIIDDPVAAIHLSIDPNTKTAYKTSAADQKKADESGFTLTLSDSPRYQIIDDHAKDPTTTDLGVQLIEGLPAKGTKYTRTIPAGAIGNDSPLVITTETWFSPDLKILLLSKSNDPRVGETTYQLTNLSRAEPNPSLFQIPSGYTVKDQPNKMIFVNKLDK